MLLPSLLTAWMVFRAVPGFPLVDPAPGGHWVQSTESKSIRETSVQPPPEFQSGKTGFALRFHGVTSPYEVFCLFVLPGDTVHIQTVFEDTPRLVTVDAADGRLFPTRFGRWRWTAPDRPGLYPLKFVDPATRDSITLNAFVLRRFDHRSEVVNGYRIGRYEFKPLRNNPAYRRPGGFVELTPGMEDVPVSPHFTLGQFVAKQEAGFPRYLILREPLFIVLENLLERVNHLGFNAQTFHVMSGYRTPYYNKRIGNETIYSRHVYGDAADIFVDVDGDENMDDLDGDGDITVEDARYLADLVERMAAEPWFAAYQGGLGSYKATNEHGPFIHVDTRGARSRW